MEKELNRIKRIRCLVKLSLDDEFNNKYEKGRM